MTHPTPADGFTWTPAPWGFVLRCAPLLDAADHFFTTRDLLLSDDAAQWEQVAALAGVTGDRLLRLRQVHGAGVAVAGAGREARWQPPEADVIATDDAEVAICVQTADCVPILLAEDTGRAVAAVHAGWRGLAARAPIEGVNALLRRFGVRPERLLAAIGPAINPCCYEVGPEVRQAFVDAGHHPSLLDRWFEPHPSGKYYLDTVQAARTQLEGTGIPASRVYSSNLCTRTYAERFHSYRADGPRAGRMAAVVRARRP